jgi:hypothetical protein
MKKLIFTLIFTAVMSLIYGQTTYYWVGGTTPAAGGWNTGSNWNTSQDGSGTSRTAAADDILIFDGSNVGGESPATGPVTVSLTSQVIGKLVLQNGADVKLTRNGSGGTTTLTIGDNPDGDDLIVFETSTLRIGGTTGSLLLLLANNAGANNLPPATTSATARIYGHVVMEEGSTTQQNRFTTRLKGAFVFTTGSTLTTAATYAFYAFGTTGSGTTPAAGGVLFEAGSHFYYDGGLSPFGSNSSSYLVTFSPGSKMHFRAQPTNTQMFNNRPYGDVYIENNATVTADGTLARVDSFVVKSGATFVTHTSGSTPVSGHLVVDGTFRAPAADPDRNNRLVMVGAAPQNISGAGTITLSDFIVSNQSNVTLQKAIQVDSATIVIGSLNPNGNAINGTGSMTIKAPASVNVTGSFVVDSFLVKNVSDFTEVEIGMSVTGTGIQPNTVITNTSSTNSTFTLSRSASVSGNGTALNVFNGQGALLPIRFGNISASLVNGQSIISWTVLLEENIDLYDIERSANGTNFNAVGTVKASGVGQYSFTDVKPIAGSNFYRIKAVGKDGEIKYSNILRVTNSTGKSELSVYPNPVKNGNLNIQMNNFEKGSYTIRVINTSGQTVYAQVIKHSGGSLNQTIYLPGGGQGGIYSLNVMGEKVNVNHRLIIE